MLNYKLVNLGMELSLSMMRLNVFDFKSLLCYNVIWERNSPKGFLDAINPVRHLLILSEKRTEKLVRRR